MVHCRDCGNDFEEDDESDEDAEWKYCRKCGCDWVLCSSCSITWRGCDYCHNTDERAGYCPLCWERLFEECHACEGPFGVKKRACESCRAARDEKAQQPGL